MERLAKERTTENSFLVLVLPLTGCAFLGRGCRSEPPFCNWTMSLMNPVLVHKVTVKEIKHGSYQAVAIRLPGYGSKLPFVTLVTFLPMSVSCL